MQQEELQKDTLNEEVEVDTKEETTEDNVSDINSKLEENKLKEEINSINEQYMRLQADYSNYRRRTQQEKETIGLFANEKILNDFLAECAEYCVVEKPAKLEGRTLTAILAPKKK